MTTTYYVVYTQTGIKVETNGAAPGAPPTDHHGGWSEERDARKAVEACIARWPQMLFSITKVVANARAANPPVHWEE